MLVKSTANNTNNSTAKLWANGFGKSLPGHFAYGPGTKFMGSCVNYRLEFTSGTNKSGVGEGTLLGALVMVVKLGA